VLRQRNMCLDGIFTHDVYTFFFEKRSIICVNEGLEFMKQHHYEWGLRKTTSKGCREKILP
jgi:hypothetical protein